MKARGRNKTRLVRTGHVDRSSWKGRLGSGASARGIVLCSRVPTHHNPITPVLRIRDTWSVVPHYHWVEYKLERGVNATTNFYGDATNLLNLTIVPFSLSLTFMSVSSVSLLEIKPRQAISITWHFLFFHSSSILRPLPLSLSLQILGS